MHMTCHMRELVPSDGSVVVYVAVFRRFLLAISHSPSRSGLGLSSGMGASCSQSAHWRPSWALE